MKRVTVSLLQEVIKELKEKIQDSFITHISLISSEDIILSFSFYKKEKLLISLNHHQPFLSLIETKENFPTLLNNMNDVFRKEIGGAYIRDISLKENDRVVTFTLQKSNDYFEKVTYYLILELIPHRANILLLDENRKILFASHYTSANSSRIILKGMVYEELPKPENTLLNDDVDLLAFKVSAGRYLEEAKNKRRKDKYDHLFTHVKSKIKSLHKKIELLNKSLIEANNDLSYKEMGDLCYMIENDPSLLDEYLSQGLLKNYDRSLSPSENALIYFKKYKKAKSAIAHSGEEIVKAQDEIANYERILFQLENGNDDDLEEIAALLKPQKGHKETRIRPNKKNKISPYYVKVGETRIGFGKTDEQNNILTFEKSLPNYEYFHIANYHGSHVVILKDNPNNEERLIAAEIALILSKKEDGDVFHTKIKDVKKGSHLGLVNLRTHELIHLDKVRDETKDLLLTMKKMN